MEKPRMGPFVYYQNRNLILNALCGVLFALCAFSFKKGCIDLSKTVTEVDPEHLWVPQSCILLCKIVAVTVLAVDPCSEDITDVE